MIYAEALYIQTASTFLNQSVRSFSWMKGKSVSHLIVTPTDSNKFQQLHLKVQ